MRHAHYQWFTQRLGRDMGVNVYGHYGQPILVFPTSGGDEHEYAGQGMIGALARHIDDGHVKMFCIASVNNESWYNDRAHPRHRSYVQAMYDDYVIQEVVPFIRTNCESQDIAISTTGSSFGAYHAANSLLKHPETFVRCLALSGVYDVKRFMDGDYDDNCYFNNPVDYVANITDPAYLARLNRCDIRLVTGHGLYEDSRPTYQLAEVLTRRGIRHSVDDWGAEGGHDWPYWKRQMDEYLGRLY